MDMLQKARGFERAYTFEPPITDRVAWQDELTRLFYSHGAIVWTLVGVALLGFLAVAMLAPRKTWGLAVSTVVFIAGSVAALMGVQHLYDNPPEEVVQATSSAVSDESEDIKRSLHEWMSENGVDPEELCDSTFTVARDGEKQSLPAGDMILCGGEENSFVTSVEGVTITTKIDNRGILASAK